MHKFQSIFAFIFIIAFPYRGSSQSESYGNVKVYLYDKKTKKRLANSYLSLEKYKSPKKPSTRTDSSGFYSFSNIPYGEYSFYCSPNAAYGAKTNYHSIYLHSFILKSDSIAVICYAKRKHDFYFDRLIARINFQQGWRGMGEISLGMAHYEEDHHRKLPDINHLESVEAGCQFNFSDRHFVIGPSLTYNRADAIVCFGSSLIYFTDFEKGTLFLNPHVGFSYNTYFDLYFGYNIPLMKNSMKGLVNRFTVTLSVPLFQRFKLFSENTRCRKKSDKLMIIN